MSLLSHDSVIATKSTELVNKRAVSSSIFGRRERALNKIKTWQYYSSPSFHISIFKYGRNTNNISMILTFEFFCLIDALLRFVILTGIASLHWAI